MSTSARIGILLPGGTVRCITVQQDGYPGYAGKILTRHYTSEERILELLSRGDLRPLTADPRDCEVALNANRRRTSVCPGSSTRLSRSTTSTSSSHLMAGSTCLATSRGQTPIDNKSCISAAFVVPKSPNYQAV